MFRQREGRLHLDGSDADVGEADKQMKRALGLVIAVWLLSPRTGFADALQQPEWIPANLKVPPGNAVILRGLAVGVQIYDCRATQSGPQWVFRAPEAGLFRGNAQLIVTHYAGPTWQALDGSRVAGALVASSPAPNPGSIPWLLLRAASHEGTGTLSGVTYIQRVLTGGGTSPAAESCSANQVGSEARVEYIAVYHFYVAKPD
jgi:hypothetical protein